MKLAEIEVNADADVVTINYVAGTAEDAPDLTAVVEQMVPELVGREACKGKPMIYLDGAGVWDEVVIEDGKFVGFRSLGYLKDRERAIERACKMKQIVAEAENNPASAATLAMLMIPKGGKDQVRFAPLSDLEPAEAFTKTVEGLHAITMGKCLSSHEEILSKVLENTPGDRRQVTADVLNQVRAGYADLLARVASNIGNLATVLTHSQMLNQMARERAQVQAAVDQAKTESKH